MDPWRNKIGSCLPRRDEEVEAEGDGADGGDAAHDVGRVVEEAAPVRHAREHRLEPIMIS